MKKLLSLIALVFGLAQPALAADTGQTTIAAFPFSSISASWNDHTMDGSTDAMESFLQCEEACAITKLCYRYGARTGTPPTFLLALQGVNSSGRADGTTKSSGNASASFTPPADTTQDATIQCKTLTSSYTCTRGEYLAANLTYSSGTINASNKSTFSYSNANTTDYRYPYVTRVNSGTPTKGAGWWPGGYYCGSTAYGNLVQSAAQFDFGANSTPDERGNIFTVPSSSCTSFKIDKARWNGYVNVAASTVAVVIYEGTTVRQDASLDTDNEANAGGWTEVQFDEGYTFSCGTAYRIVVKPTSTGGTSTGLWYADFAANADMNSLPLGINMYYTSRSDAGSFTDLNTRRAQIDFTLSDITASGGGSGGLIPSPNTQGGSQ